MYTVIIEIIAVRGVCMYRYINNSQKQGFTLVEMSIVIIIIGLLIAGVAAGTSLIEQAKLNSVVVDFRNHEVAYYSFISKYGQPPGDFNSGALYWPNTCVTDNDPTYCNGNGDGVISTINLDEQRMAWKHLSLAGLISNGFAALPDDAGSEFSASFPPSKVEGAYYTFEQAGNNGVTSGHISSIWPDAPNQNALYIAKPSGIFASFGGPTVVPNLGALAPQEAFSLDNKLDDGTVSSAGDFIGATTGQVRSKDDGTSAASPCVTVANNNIYNVSGDKATCIFSQLLTN